MSGGEETIKELKAAILAIDWEINDEAMDALLQAIEPLKEEWAGRKPLLVCLQVIGTLGQYIKKAREKAHPEAIKLLPDVFSTLESVVTDATLDNKSIVTMVRSAVDKYNRLKEDLAKPRPAAPPQPAPAEAGQGGTTMRSLMDEKEDKAVDGAFDSIFQGMVGGEGEPGRPEAAPAPPAMPSSTHQMVDGDKEVVSDRVDDEVFQEADDLLDDFFADDELGLSLEEEEQPAEVEAVDDTVQVDIGQVESEEPAVEEVVEEAVSEEPEEEVQLENLERLVKQVSQEATTPLLNELADEVAALRSQFPNHSSMHLFLQFIDAIGRHLAGSDELSDQSCQMLQQVHDRLAHSLFTMQSQQNLLEAHQETISDYIAWHEQLVSSMKETGTAAVEQAAPQVEGEIPDGMRDVIKEMVRREVEELRSELLQMIEAQ